MRYAEAGKGKPVWMILQAFSWPELGEQYIDRPNAYPSFNESRYMAYIAISSGARGIIYWGGTYAKSNDFLQSIFAVTSELSFLQPFLSAVNEDQVKVNISIDPVEKSYPVSCIARRFGRDWMIAVINETDTYQMGVVVNGLKHLNGFKFKELYGDQEVTVSNEEIILRMKPREVKVFATSENWETARNKGEGLPWQLANPSINCRKLKSGIVVTSILGNSVFQGRKC